MSAPTLTVLRPGLQTTVQDEGRRGMQRHGVPPSGALDSDALHAASLLAGNPPGLAALEVTHHGPTLRVDAPSLRLAVVGAAGDVTVVRDGTRHEVGPWRSVTLRRGDVLDVGRVHGGLRCCIAVAGGIDVPVVLGSRSTYLRAGLGGVEGRALRAGDVLPVGVADAADGDDLALDPPDWWDADGPVRVVPGPHAGSLTPAGRGTLLGDGFTVSPRSDRVGLRLAGPPVAVVGAERFASEPCAVGSVQVTAGGLPIVLLADRGTTGGYPKPVTVATVDLPRLARLRPGDPLRLAEVTRDAALAALRERAQRLSHLETCLRGAPPVPG